MSSHKLNDKSMQMIFLFIYVKHIDRIQKNIIYRQTVANENYKPLFYSNFGIYFGIKTLYV